MPPRSTASRQAGPPACRQPWPESHSLKPAAGEEWDAYLQWTNGSRIKYGMTFLEEAGYIEVVKEFVDRKPMTMLSLTDKGRTAFSEYRKNLGMAIKGTG